MDIPDDIRATAMQLACILSANFSRHVEQIARALLAQDKAATERAAKIAESHNRRDEDDFLEPEAATSRNVTARFIAAAIRQP